MSLSRACIACAVLLAAAQAEEVGSLAGTVVDQSGAGVSGVQLRLREIVGDRAQAQSGGRGEFRFSNLAPGIYSIEATASGFDSASAGPIRVPSRAEATVKIVMRLGREVSCDPGPRVRFDPIQSTSSEIDGVVEGPGSVPSGVKYPIWGPRENVLVTATGPILLTENGRTSGGLVALTHTDKKGHFILAIQEPGMYTVTAHQDGYADFIVEDVVARAGQRAAIQWPIPLSFCPTAGHCESNREFLPLVCM